LLAAVFLLATAAAAAPPADPKLLDLWSRMDELHAARGVQKPAAPRELKRAPDAAVGKVVDAFLAENQNTGLVVLRGDAILAERYQYGRGEGDRFSSASVAKTVLAMLVGIALHEKKISSIDDLASTYIPELKGHPYGETSIRHLLTMSSGMAERENQLIANTLRQGSAGGVNTILDFNQREAPAGTRFRYNSADSQVLGLVLIHATKKPLADYLSEKIWQPMGAEAHATWIVDKGGFETGFCCINARLRDFARFGMLLASYGRLDGRQIIPEAWVKAATTPEAPHLRVGTATPNNGYGYQTWILGNKDRHPRASGDPVFAAFGLHGQAIFIDPASRVVVVHAAAWDDGNDRTARGRQFRLFESILARVDGR
jgi:CubicO group peptidase (beta-lactamase class C family)